MKNNRFLVIIMVLSSHFFYASCKSISKPKLRKNGDNITSCVKNWKYIDLIETKEIVVLLFEKKNQLGSINFANFIIGYTNNGDTFAFMDKNSNLEIKVGQNVKIVPMHWDESDKDIYKPTIKIFDESFKNNLYCDVKILYFGKFEFK